jgi:hypothetical protein
MSQHDIVRVGADPEVFVKHLPSRAIIPVCGLVGGTKEEPNPFPGLLVRSNEVGIYAFQEDGVAFEFNVPATTTPDRFATNIRSVWITLKEMLRGLELDPQLKAEHAFKESELTSPQAQRLGCIADMWAYGKDGPEKRTAFEAAQFGNRRFCGGHLHLGYNRKVPPHIMVKFLDVLLGLPSLLHDKQGMRRQYYGLPGLYREKPYGLEYRSLSNYWLRGCQRPDNSYLIMLSGAMIDLGITAQTRPEVLANAYKMIPWDDVKDAITQENVDLGKEIFQYAINVAKLPARYAHDMWRVTPEGKVSAE